MNPAQSTPTNPLETILATDEDLLWHARPAWRSLACHYLLSGIPLFVIIGPFLFFTLILGTFALAIATQNFLLLATGFVLSATTTLGVIAGVIYIAAKRSYANAEYAVTNDRLIAFGGIFGRDYTSIQWDAIQDLEVTVGWLDTKFGTGTIEAITAGGDDSGVEFAYVPSPYEVLEAIESERRRHRP